jgi:hypothetical protein
MGSGSGSFSAIQQYDLGWLSGRMQDVPATGGSYTLQPLENAEVGQQVLRMVDGAATLWLEYRQPLGVDSSLDPANAGVLVRQQLPDQGLKSFLLDMTPGSTQGFRDARMPTGSTWVNPLGTMKITVNSASAAGAQVTIESALPIVPNVRGRTLAGAGQALGGAGFAVGSLANVIDHSCNNIGLVMSQSPSAGARAPAGTRVNLWVGRRPPHACP